MATPLAETGRCRMDPNNPNVKALVAFAQEIWGEYIRTHTMEEILAMKAEAERERQLRRRMFGGRVQQINPASVS